MEIDHLQVLRTDASGMPLEWIGYQEAAKLYHLGQVAYACGSRLFTLRGGFNAKNGSRSLLEIYSI
ncbi:MAG: HNH endonuclease, partial [Candidatus Methylumidiphilus sp.]